MASQKAPGGHKSDLLRRGPFLFARHTTCMASLSDKRVSTKLRKHPTPYISNFLLSHLVTFCDAINVTVGFCWHVLRTTMHSFITLQIRRDTNHWPGSTLDKLIVLVDTGSRATVYGFLDQVFRSTLWHDDFRLFRISVEPEHFRANFFTGAAPNTLFLIDMNSHPDKLQLIIFYERTIFY